VLVAAGRTPNTEQLGLSERGIAVSPAGGIVIDDRMRTTCPGVYAAGDVTGRDQFYMAALDGRSRMAPTQETGPTPAGERAGRSTLTPPP